MPSAGEDRVERLGESGIAVSEQKLDRGGPVAEVHHQIASDLSGPCTGRMRAHSRQVRPAGAMLNRDQGIDPGEEHGVHVPVMRSCA
jgi:hypothetical protein